MTMRRGRQPIYRDYAGRHEERCLFKHDRGKAWSEDGWKKVVIHTVSDSRREAIGTNQEGVVTNVVDGSL